jgi:hypothetical protein
VRRERKAGRETYQSRISVRDEGATFLDVAILWVSSVPPPRFRNIPKKDKHEGSRNNVPNKGNEEREHLVLGRGCLKKEISHVTAKNFQKLKKN